MDRLPILKLLVVLILCITATTPGSAQDEKAMQAARAGELLQKARAAIGGEQALRQIQSLSVSGKLRRHIRYISVQGPDKVQEKNKTLSGKVEFDFLLPDKFRKKVKGSTLSGWGYSYAEVVNGERAWRNPPLPVTSSNKDRRVLDVSDVERSFERMAREARHQITIYTLAWFLQPPPAVKLDFKYIGSTLLDDRRVEAVLAQGKNDFNVVLFLDAQTYLPVAMALTFVESRRDNVIVEVASVSRSYIRATYARARQEQIARIRPLQRHELQLRFSEHRPAGGAQLPHHLTIVLDGEVIEELTVGGFKINQGVKASKFDDEPERVVR